MLVKERVAEEKGLLGDPTEPELQDRPPQDSRRWLPLFLKVAVISLLLVVNVASVFTGRAVGSETAGSSTGELKEQMDSIQSRLDATTARIEELRTQKDNVQTRIEGIRTRLVSLSAREAKLQSEVVKRAKELYKSGTSTMVATLLDAQSLPEVMDRAEALSHVSMDDSSIFISLARSQAELDHLNDELAIQRAELAGASESVLDESKRLQTQFAEVKGDYERLTRRLAPASAEAPASSANLPVLRSTDGMFCPVAGPVSFTDSWGAPRAGHTHQGVDMMGSYGTPLVAVTSGSITYAAYDGSGGNMLFLSGDDGNAYYYMHNQENLVSGGHVEAGQQIATLGDTGNAAGTPHLHFEYHPGGGAAVNPYPLVASLC